MLSESTGKKLLDEIMLVDLKIYNNEEVERIKNEIKYIDNKIELLKENAEKYGITEELSVNFSFLKSYKNRNDRILKAYIFDRLLKITENYFIKNNIFGLLSAREKKFYLEFSTISDAYLEPYRHLDLINTDPPLDFYVQIITLDDCGTILNGDEFIDLKKNRLYYIKKADIAHLINAKLVKII